MKNWAYAGVVSVFGIVASMNGFQEMWARSSIMADPTLFVARLAIFVALLLLTLRWVIATHCEFEMWVTWLDNPFQRTEVYAAIIGLSIALGLVLAFPHKVVVMTSLVSVEYLFNYWTQWLSNEHFRRALTRTRRGALSTMKKQVLHVMEHYWLQLPQLGRLVTMMFFACIAFALALAGTSQPQGTARYFDLWAYGILVADIVIGEIIVAVWRHSRDARIRKICGD